MKVTNDASFPVKALLNPEIEVPKAPLAKTREHHVALGSSDGSRKPGEYRKTPAEMMDDAELRTYMEGELELVRAEHAKLGKEREGHVKMYRMIRDRFLMANLRYLAEIGRLPDGFDIDALEKELEVPDGIE
ncbi:MAG TPA: hypothetical protein PKA42_00080 [Candidatus Paceibacterota bacterium]|nr:hypothetical protein [Candidatus Paceibacterota bacterium]HMO82544.1 hypothetical protein [Candidatus Paceibacterota bacterium]